VTGDERIDEIMLSSLSHPKSARHLVDDVLRAMRRDVQRRLRILLERGELELNKNLDIERSEPKAGGR
jgi:hypothetical protein